MIAAYVNPRTTRLAEVVEHGGKLAFRGRANYTTREFESFEHILHRFLRSHGSGSTLTIAASGPASPGGGMTHMLPWGIDAMKLAERFSFRTVRLYNEHLATARSIFDLGSDHIFTISHKVAARKGNIAIITVDDSLEEVMMVHEEGRYTTFASAGGLTGFGPSSQLEAELWQHLYAQREFIAMRDVVSYDGLVRLFEYFLETRGLETPEWYATADDRPARIVERALSGEDTRAVEAVDLLVDCLAGEAANLALRGMAFGGVYLAGRIVTELLPALDKGQFLDNFLKRGAGEETLRRIPIHVIMDRNAAMLGAVRLAVESGCNL